jgi:hypothetical protein
VHALEQNRVKSGEGKMRTSLFFDIKKVGIKIYLGCHYLADCHCFAVLLCIWYVSTSTIPFHYLHIRVTIGFDKGSVKVE